MAYLDVNFEKKDIEWKWADNSILDHISEHTIQPERALRLRQELKMTE